MEKHYTKREKNAYLIGMMGQNIIYSIIGTGLAFYYQSVIFIPAMAISVILTLAQVLDAVKDPVIGMVIDNTSTKWGKCRPYLIFCPFVIGMLTILAFLNKGYHSSNTTSVNVIIITWAGISYILWGLVYTFGDIPLWGLAPLMSESESGRSKLMANARIAASIGNSIVMVSIIPVSQQLGRYLERRSKNTGNGLQHGFLIVVVILTILGSVMLEGAGLFTKEYIRTENKEKVSLKDSIQVIMHCRPFCCILLSGVLRSPIMLLSTVEMTLFAYYYGNNGNDPYMLFLLILGGGNMVGQLFAIYITPILLEKHEKRSLYNICCIGSAIAYVLIFILYLLMPNGLNRPAVVFLLFWQFLFTGMGNGCINVIQSVMIADTIDYEEYHNGFRPDGIFNSGQSFIIKLSAGIASIISGVSYAIVGFSGDHVRRVNEALNNGAVFRTEPDFAKYRFIMFFLCSIPPAAGCLLSMLPMKHYHLTNEKHREILDKLIQIRK